MLPGTLSPMPMNANAVWQSIKYALKREQYTIRA